MDNMHSPRDEDDDFLLPLAKRTPATPSAAPELPKAKQPTKRRSKAASSSTDANAAASSASSAPKPKRQISEHALAARAERKSTAERQKKLVETRARFYARVETHCAASIGPGGAAAFDTLQDMAMRTALPYVKLNDKRDDQLAWGFCTKAPSMNQECRCQLTKLCDGDKYSTDNIDELVAANMKLYTGHGATPVDQMKCEILQATCSTLRNAERAHMDVLLEVEAMHEATVARLQAELTALRQQIVAADVRNAALVEQLATAKRTL